MGSADVCVLCQILLQHQHQHDTFSRIGYYCITIDHSARKGRKVIIMASFLDFFQISVGALTRESVTWLISMHPQQSTMQLRFSMSKELVRSLFTKHQKGPIPPIATMDEAMLE
jgi:hypothetical protein